MARKPAKRSGKKPARPVEQTAGKPPRPASSFTGVGVGVGASAGGIEAFTQMLRALPPDTGMAFVFFLHMGKNQKSALPDIVARATKMPVHEVLHAIEMEPNHVYVVAPGMDLQVDDGRLIPSERDGEGVAARTIDHFFRSLAANRTQQAIGVVLSGGASDGAVGLEEIKGEGGITFAQDDTALHLGMPHAAIATHRVDMVLPPEGIARELGRIAAHPLAAADNALSDILPEVDITEVLEALHRATGVDFSHYKRQTLQRRISRRMVLQRIDTLRDYAAFLHQTPIELDALYQDVLIGVTSFFRDPESFEALKTDIFPGMMSERSRREGLRFWTLGCSTGEEAYSIGIAYSEFSEEAGHPHALQIFATDLNGRGIDRARAGIYPTSIANDVSPERLRRYFSEADGGYRVRKSIRDVCVFARHNILAEPPFSRIDLISCRNLLIYLSQEMQQRIIPILHYALKPDGYLWLGRSETIGPHRELFELVDTRHKLYRKKPAVPRLVLPNTVTGFRPQEHAHKEIALAVPPAPSGSLLESQKESERILLNRYAPSSVLVNSSYEILQFRGNTGVYLEPSPGRPSLNLLKMLREGLLVPVRNLLNAARKGEGPVRKEGLRLRSDGEFRTVAVEVIPVTGRGGAPGNYLVLFEETGSRERTARLKREKTADRENDTRSVQPVELQRELAATREYLQSVIEQQEAANEELQSANEEIQSANEELQSINEELETSKEEVQSSNEELATVNDELTHRNAELSRSNNDLVNLFSSVQMAIIMLDSSLRIRRLTPAAEKMLNLIPADVGRPIRDLNLNISLGDLERQLEEVIDTVSVREFEVTDRHGRWHLLRLRPYRTVDNRIDGVVVIFIDIDSIKRDQQRMHQQAELLEQAHEPILMWEIAGPIIYWNRAAEEIYGYSKAEALSRRNHEMLGTLQSAAAIEESLEKYGRWTGKVVHTTRDGRKISMDSRMSLVRETGGRRLVIETNRPLEDD